MKFYNFLVLMLAIVSIVGCSEPAAKAVVPDKIGTRLTYEQQLETWNAYKESMHSAVLKTGNPEDQAVEDFVLSQGQFVDDHQTSRSVLEKGFYVLVVNGDPSAQTEWEKGWAGSNTSVASWIPSDKVMIIKRGGLPVPQKMAATLLLHEGGHAMRSMTGVSGDPHNRRDYLKDELLAHLQQARVVRSIYAPQYEELRTAVLAKIRVFWAGHETGVPTMSGVTRATRIFFDKPDLAVKVFGLSQNPTFDEVGVPMQYVLYDCVFELIDQTSASSAQAEQRKLDFLDKIYPNQVH